MPEIIACPECGRQLRVTEDLFGQLVKCPSCQATFTAAAPDAPPPRGDGPRGAYEVREEPAGRRRPDDRPPRRYSDEDEDDDRGRPGRRRPPLDYDEDRMKPHRGATVLTLGILSLVLSCIPLAAWILGGIALGMANNDLQAMARRRMDPAGQGQTRAGQVCGIIGVILGVFSCLGIWRASMMGRRF
jgi:predicted Zn finger-like uncharacterized protein